MEDTRKKRLLSLTADADDWLRSEAKRLGISVTELLRRLVDERRGESPGPAPVAPLRTR